MVADQKEKQVSIQTTKHSTTASSQNDELELFTLFTIDLISTQLIYCNTYQRYEIKFFIIVLFQNVDILADIY